MQQAKLLQPASSAAAIPSQTYSTTQQQQAPHTVEKMPAAKDNDDASIPLMPKGFIGMMSEAVGGGANKDKTPHKKDN